MNLPRLAAAAALAPCLCAAVACGFHQAPVIPPQGFLYQDVTAPLTVDFDGTPVGSANTKSGSQSTKYLDFSLFLIGLNFGWDDAAVEEIARRNGITTISYAEYRHVSFFSVYRQFTITVHGN